MKNNLNLFLCSHQLAKFAVLNYHYSRCMPAGKLFKVGVKENEKFIGVVIFSRGANFTMGKYFGLKTTEVVELSRVALTTHQTPVSRILKIAIKIYKKNNPKTGLIFSYADETNQNHKGGIYRADNWVYLGERRKAYQFLLNGKPVHSRSLGAKFGCVKNWPKTVTKKLIPQIKHLFVKFLCESSKESVVRRFHLREGGATPTDSLIQPLKNGGAIPP